MDGNHQRRIGLSVNERHTGNKVHRTTYFISFVVSFIFALAFSVGMGSHGADLREAYYDRMGLLVPFSIDGDDEI
jgi:hypothetical protein